VVGKKEHGERLYIGIKNGGYQFPLLLADKGGLFLDHNQFCVRQLNSVFSPKLEIDWAQIPSRFVPIDQDSELWEVAEVIIPKILQYMTERRPRVKVIEISHDVFSTWLIMGKPARDQSISKIRDTLRAAAQSHFRQYLRWMGRIDSVEIMANPLDLQPDKRTTAYRNLRTAQKNFIDSLKSGGQPLLPL
jgi:hypothetical protein